MTTENHPADDHQEDDASVESLQNSVRKLEENRDAILQEKRDLSTKAAETEQQFSDYARGIALKAIMAQINPMDGAEVLFENKLAGRVNTSIENGELKITYLDGEKEITADELIKQIREDKANATFIKGVDSTGAGASGVGGRGFTSRKSGSEQKPGQFGLGK